MREIDRMARIWARTYVGVLFMPPDMGTFTLVFRHNSSLYHSERGRSHCRKLGSHVWTDGSQSKD
jgi:hypothetical protein